MEVKKSSKASLEDKKGLFFEIGLVVALGVMFLAFEWKVDNSTTKEIEETVIIPEEEIFIPATSQMLAPPPPPPPPPRLADLIDIVENDEEIDEELELIDAEDEKENEVQQNYDYSADYGEYSSGEEEVFAVVEVNPAFDGDLMKWLGQNLEYPSAAQEYGIQGVVNVQFVVEKDGSISNIKVLRKIDPLLDEEAVRVVKKMPKWKPGLQRNRAVRAYFVLPIRFVLN